MAFWRHIKHGGNKSTMKENVYKYMDNLTVLDIEKLAAQDYEIIINDGHVIAAVPEGKEYTT